MNIPAELIIIANTCDAHNLHEEADTLTEIAKIMLKQKGVDTSSGQNIPGYTPYEIQAPNAQEVDINLQQPMGELR